MKIKRLIPALCMLLISAILLGTSTYAWFSMNTTVTATNMTIKATTSKNLMISLNEATGYTASVDMDVTSENMRPASTIGGNIASPNFFIIDSVGTEMTQDNYARGSDTTIKAAAASDYAKKTVYLKSIGDNATNLKAAITKTDATSKEIDKAIRVMLVVKNGDSYTSYIYSPVTGAAYGTAGKAVQSKDSSNKAVLGDIATAATSGDTVILASMTQDAAYQVDIYAWYEGEDTNCKATNTLDMDNYQFDVEFTVA